MRHELLDERSWQPGELGDLTLGEPPREVIVCQQHTSCVVAHVQRPGRCHLTSETHIQLREAV
jgi:hypothetical protein